MAGEFKLPRSIPVFSHTYRVKELKHLRNEKGDELFGDTDAMQQHIRLEAGMRESKRKEIFWHEVLETLTTELYIKLKHSDITGLAHGLSPIIDRVIKAQKK